MGLVCCGTCGRTSTRARTRARGGDEDEDEDEDEDDGDNMAEIWKAAKYKVILGGAETGERSGSALERRAKLELDLCNEAAVALCVPPHRRVAALRFLTPDPRSPTELLVCRSVL